MHKITLLLALTFSFTFCKASEKPQEIKAPISTVKVCLNSALITHSQKVKLKSGITKLAFVGLAMNIDKRHISLRNLGKSELLSIQLVKISDTTNINYLPADALALIRNGKDSILTLEKNIEKARFELDGLWLERSMLTSNTDIIPNSKTISLAELKITTDYYRERYAAIGKEIQDKERELVQLKKNKVRALKAAFDVENSEEKNMSISIIIAELNNPESEFTADLELSYLARESGWIPVYEVLSKDNKTLHMNYRAKILNNTGIDWENLNVTLSTADPSQYYSAPDLEPFIITASDGNKYNKRYDYDDDDEDDYDNNSSNSNNPYGNNTNKVKPPKPKSTVEEEEIFTPDHEINFNIAKKYTFRSGLTPSFVDVTSYDLTPDYIYRSAPKKEEQVYSIARIKDWEKLNLIDGEADIYNNGSFLGKSYIRPSDLEDYLELPLGVVDYIFIKHKQVSEFSSKKVLSGGVVATCSYEIKIKNNSTEKINVEIIDQVPVSERSNVKTENVEFTEGGDKDDSNGKVVWKLELGPSSEKTLSIKYSVSYPRGFRYSQSYRKRKIRAKF